MMFNPRRERILYTRHDGGVAICHPAAECMAWMTGGGGYWDQMPRGYAEEQVQRQISAGHQERAARRFCRAMTQGGCTDAEALDIIRDRDCGHLGTAFELLDVSAIATDRWFRDAWRRSHNGGPIYIPMSIAREIQIRRMKHYAKQHDYAVRWPYWRERARRTTSPEQLKALWPWKASQ